jgi:hypothetical protein
MAERSLLGFTENMVKEMAAQLDRELMDKTLAEGMPYMAAGMPVITSPYALVEEEELRERSFRERFFSRPWRPFTRYEIRTKQVPGAFLVYNTLYAHPDCVEHLCDEVAK